jgi:hypothetical protein
MEQNLPAFPRQWRLSEALYKALHQWYLILIFGLIGAGLGWGASYLWPPAYRTQATIYVSLNPYRAYSDSQFIALAYPQYTNIDDYKNWQMSQLSAAIVTDEILRSTLALLRQDDKYWNDIDTDTLRSMLKAEWRTAGAWSLQADNSNARRSNQAVRAWSRAVASGIKQAIFASEQLIQIDQARQEILEEKTSVALLQQDYDATKKILQDWLSQAGSLPQDQPLQTEERWKVLYLAGRIAQFSPSWIDILKDQPAADALPPEYVNWVRRIISAIENESPALAVRWEYLNQQEKILSAEYEKQKEASLGLSSNMTIKEVEKGLPETIRPTAQLVLVGAIAGLLAWVIWLLFTLTRQKLIP